MLPEVWASIDFETADPKRDSACAVGLVRVEGAEIVYRETALIKPPRGVSPICYQIHGLTWNRLKNEPTFREVWPKLAPILAGVKFLVAHNAPFDKSVLKACCEAASLAVPTLPWVCTCALAKQKWPSAPSHKLPDVCRRLGIPLANHHEAGADAEAAARVLIALEGRKPTPKAEPVPAAKPQSAAWKILEQIPAAHQTPAVLALMRDAESLGEAHARDLVALVGRWFTREEPGRPKCPCGGIAILVCGLCQACIQKIPHPAAVPVERTDGPANPTEERT